MISIQMGPQTRLLQNNDALMIEKIQSSLVNTIPLWKSQMVLALGLENSRQAVAAQNAVTNMTNEMLKKNADMLKSGTVAVAKESERSIVDIETLQHTNEQLISTLDAVSYTHLGHLSQGFGAEMISLHQQLQRALGVKRRLFVVGGPQKQQLALQGPSLLLKCGQKRLFACQ